MKAHCWDCKTGKVGSHKVMQMTKNYIISINIDAGSKIVACFLLIGLCGQIGGESTVSTRKSTHKPHLEWTLGEKVH